MERIVIDEELQYFVEEWIHECEDAGVDYNKGLAIIDTIEFKECLTLFKLGELNREKRKITISTQVLKKDHYFQRLIVFHELGHTIDLPHTCGKLSIMNPLLSHKHTRYYTLWWEQLMEHYFTDTISCYELDITVDSIVRWTYEYESYCDYSNSTVGPL